VCLQAHIYMIGTEECENSIAKSVIVQVTYMHAQPILIQAHANYLAAVRASDSCGLLCKRKTEHEVYILSIYK
jgi:hypothetical protein